MARIPGDDQPSVFSADPGWDFPDVGKRVVPAGGRVDVAADDQSYSEYDTADGDLARFGAVISRSRARDWRLDLDGVQLSAAGTSRAVPAELRDAVLGVRAGRALSVRREVQRRRVTRVVLDPAGALLGEIDDLWQRETGAAGGSGGDRKGAPHDTRRIELIAVDQSFGTAVARRLVASGARRVPAAPAGPQREVRTVGDAVRGFLDAQRTEILRGDVRLRRGEDAIHPTRVAVRRVRSILRVVAVFEPQATAALDRDLWWLSGVLGSVRDTDVLRDHLAGTFDALPDEPWRHAAAAAVTAALEQHAEQARASLRATMNGRRYLAVLRTLRDWADDPPLLDAAQQPAKRLVRYVRAADRVLAKRLAQAADPESTHRARKSAKRARYVSEFAVGIIGDDARAGDTGKQAKQLQTTLGDQQDAAMAAEFLAGLAAGHAVESLSPVAAFGCGVAWSAERERAAG